MSEIKGDPVNIGRSDAAYDIQAYELKRLKPSELSEHQLTISFQRGFDYGLRELACDMLVGRDKRSRKCEFDRGHFEGLIERALTAGDLNLAREIRNYWEERPWYRPYVEFRFDLLEHPDRFSPLEHDCRKSVPRVLKFRSTHSNPDRFQGGRHNNLL